MGRFVRLACALLLAAGPVLVTPALAAPFPIGDRVDLTQLLPPFPPPGSTLERAELDELRAFEASRTPARIAQAQADADESVFAMFGPILGPGFGPTLAQTGTLFGRLAETEEMVVGAAKDRFARARPFLTDPALAPTLFRSKGASYPSGHSTRVTIMGIVLARMVPERRAEIFARILDYGESRLIGGVHHRSDVVAGRLAGTAIDAVLFSDPGFMAAFAPARDEVRAALNLEPRP